MKHEPLTASIRDFETFRAEPYRVQRVGFPTNADVERWFDEQFPPFWGQRGCEPKLKEIWLENPANSESYHRRLVDAFHLAEMLRARHADVVTELKERHEKEMAEMRQAHERAIEEVRTECETKIDEISSAMQKAYENRMLVVRGSLNEMVAKSKDLHGKGIKKFQAELAEIAVCPELINNL